MTQFYYTYAYLREDRTPYYIGKGKGKRSFSKHNRFYPPSKDRILFLKKNLTEEEAFKHEIYMIAVFGRKDNGTGILHNKTNGGEGCSGFIYNEKLKETRRQSMKKIHSSRTPEQRSEIVRKANASRTPEQRSEISKKSRSLQLSKSTPEQRSEISKKSYLNKSLEQRSEIARKGGIKSCGQRWQCTETGFITNAACLSNYQRARGIDTSKRVRLF